MKNVEIERKFLIAKDDLPSDLDTFNYHEIEQAYINTHPVVRIRKSDDNYYLTYKGEGLMSREEYNLPLNEESYQHMLAKADGNIISKRRYLIPYSEHIIELDIFSDFFEGLIIAEVEFDSEDSANSFTPPSWFGEDVTFSKKYHNSNLAKCTKW